MPTSFKKVITALVAIWLAIVVNSGLNTYRVGYDSSDDHAAGKRSGMALRTDHLTGCQYLLTPGFLGLGSSITPRLWSDGKQVCFERTPPN